MEGVTDSIVLESALLQPNFRKSASIMRDIHLNYNLKITFNMETRVVVKLNARSFFQQSKLSVKLDFE